MWSVARVKLIHNFIFSETNIETIVISSIATNFTIGVTFIAVLILDENYELDSRSFHATISNPNQTGFTRNLCHRHWLLEHCTIMEFSYDTYTLSKCVCALCLGVLGWIFILSASSFILTVFININICICVYIYISSLRKL